MEDRYLFKAKRTDNGEWVEGSLITGVFFRLGQDIPYILCPDKADYDCFDYFTEENGIFEVDPSTICQCTTFKDRNGNLVWENDLLKKFTGEGDDWEIAKVILGEYCLSLGWCQAGVKSLNRYNTDLFKCALSRYDASKCEIVGNIFDNPELLESEEKE